jgi:hypothetical protein
VDGHGGWRKRRTRDLGEQGSGELGILTPAGGEIKELVILHKTPMQSGHFTYVDVEPVDWSTAARTSSKCGTMIV